MPTYQYACTECGGQLEAVQKFTDEPLTVHEDCGGRLRKVFSPVGIVFKGSGFYKTDSRNGGSASSNSAASSSTANDGDAKPKSGGDAPAPASSGSTASSASTAPPASASSAGSSGSSKEKVA